eukprot:gene2687-1685_t
MKLQAFYTATHQSFRINFIFAMTNHKHKPQIIPPHINVITITQQNTPTSKSKSATTVYLRMYLYQHQTFTKHTHYANTQSRFHPQQSKSLPQTPLCNPSQNHKHKQQYPNSEHRSYLTNQPKTITHQTLNCTHIAKPCVSNTTSRHTLHSQPTRKSITICFENKLKFPQISKLPTIHAVNYLLFIIFTHTSSRNHNCTHPLSLLNQTACIQIQLHSSNLLTPQTSKESKIQVKVNPHNINKHRQSNNSNTYHAIKMIPDTNITNPQTSTGNQTANITPSRKYVSHTTSDNPPKPYQHCTHIVISYTNPISCTNYTQYKSSECKPLIVNTATNYEVTSHEEHETNHCIESNLKSDSLLAPKLISHQPASRKQPTASAQNLNTNNTKRIYSKPRIPALLRHLHSTINICPNTNNTSANTQSITNTFKQCFIVKHRTSHVHITHNQQTQLTPSITIQQQPTPTLITIPPSKPHTLNQVPVIQYINTPPKIINLNMKQTGNILAHTNTSCITHTLATLFNPVNLSVKKQPLEQIYKPYNYDKFNIQSQLNPP